jgi:hypothetical protein
LASSSSLSVKRSDSSIVSKRRPALAAAAFSRSSA